MSMDVEGGYAHNIKFKQPSVIVKTMESMPMHLYKSLPVKIVIRDSIPQSLSIK